MFSFKLVTGISVWSFVGKSTLTTNIIAPHFRFLSTKKRVLNPLIWNWLSENLSWILVSWIIKIPMFSLVWSESKSKFFLMELILTQAVFDLFRHNLQKFLYIVVFTRNSWIRWLRFTFAARLFRNIWFPIKFKFSKSSFQFSMNLIKFLENAVFELLFQTTWTFSYQNDFLLRYCHL